MSPSRTRLQGHRKTTPPVKFRDETAKFLSMSPGKGYETETSLSPQEKQYLCQVGTTTKTKNLNPNPDLSYSQNSTWTEVSTIFPSLIPYQRDLAGSFFLTYVTIVGRSVESTRGFVELCFASDPRSTAQDRSRRGGHTSFSTGFGPSF